MAINFKSMVIFLFSKKPSPNTYLGRKAPFGSISLEFASEEANQKFTILLINFTMIIDKSFCVRIKYYHYLAKKRHRKSNSVRISKGVEKPCSQFCASATLPACGSGRWSL